MTKVPSHYVYGGSFCANHGMIWHDFDGLTLSYNELRKQRQALAVS